MQKAKSESVAPGPSIRRRASSCIARTGFDVALPSYRTDRQDARRQQVRIRVRHQEYTAAPPRRWSRPSARSRIRPLNFRRPFDMSDAFLPLRWRSRRAALVDSFVCSHRLGPARSGCVASPAPRLRSAEWSRPAGDLVRRRRLGADYQLRDMQDGCKRFVDMAWRRSDTWSGTCEPALRCLRYGYACCHQCASESSMRIVLSIYVVFLWLVGCRLPCQKAKMDRLPDAASFASRLSFRMIDRDSPLGRTRMGNRQSGPCEHTGTHPDDPPCLPRCADTLCTTPASSISRGTTHSMPPTPPEADVPRYRSAGSRPAT